MSNIVMEGLHINVGYTQQSMLLKVIEWVWFILRGKDGERKGGGRMEGVGGASGSSIGLFISANINCTCTVGEFA